ncbi:FAD-dependent monooxygenase [Nonomuraea candida]|uniref:FAD-dependent monooxygenase n=1 Tax=Nonomuraea candida TaxID=359159 RepID=UPI0005BDF29E|nr:FAD-dependent monooxygenase [Nonomuraea candida]
MNSTDVIVVGAGPTGLMLACELAQAGVRCKVLERRTAQPNITRAFAVHARTLELLDARGLADDLLERGVPVRRVQPAPGAVLDLSTLRTRYPMVLIVPQSGTEHLLEARARELGVEIVRGAEVTGLRQDGRRVLLELAGGGTESAGYVVGCDGAHSRVRGLAGIDFAGKQYETHILLADVRLAAPPEDSLFAWANREGVVLMVPFGDGWFRAIAWDRLREQVPLDVPLPLEEMRDAFLRIAGTDFGMAEQRWSSRFRSERRQARRYRAGRVFLAGDAAHVHSPLGGQGMNTGLQDAMNLGWKLAAAVRGQAPDGLLDSYERERHRVGAQVLALTDAFNRLVLGRSALRRALRALTLRLVLRLRWTREPLAGRLTGLGIRYPAPARGAHPWTGRRVPDLRCAQGRLYELLRDGRHLLVDTTRAGGVARAAGDAIGNRATIARYAGPVVAGLPGAVLIRPDGYVAWAAEDGPELPGQAVAAVVRWCGGPARTPSARPRT